MSTGITTVAIGADELNFKVGTADFNQYINEQMPTNKVAPAYNFLQRTVVAEDKEKFKKLILKDGVPNGAIVMQIAGVLALDSGADVEITVKKSQNSPTPSSKTATASS
jgi:hypothetical protein